MLWLILVSAFLCACSGSAFQPGDESATVGSGGRIDALTSLPKATGGSSASTGGSQAMTAAPSTGGEPPITTEAGSTGGGSAIAATGGTADATGGSMAGTGGQLQAGTGGSQANGSEAIGGNFSTGGSDATGGSLATGGNAPTGGSLGTGGSSAPSTPCDGLCSLPTSFVVPFTSPQLGTAASCWQTLDALQSITLADFDGRTMQVNGAAASATIPTRRAGGWCLVVSAGVKSYATFTVQ